MKQDSEEEKSTADIAWEGNSLELIRQFPKGVREDLGAELRRLQKSEKPLNSRPMKSIGPRVYEIKEQDERAWYRQKDLEMAKTRLKRVMARIREEKYEKR